MSEVVGVIPLAESQRTLSPGDWATAEGFPISVVTPKTTACVLLRRLANRLDRGSVSYPAGR